MLKQRVATGITILLIFLSGLFFLAPYVFVLCVALVVAYAAWEWSDMTGLPNAIWRVVYVALTIGAMFFTAYLLGFSPRSGPNNEVAKSFLSASCLWWLIAFFLVRGYPGSAVSWGSCWMRAVMGCLVLIPTWAATTVLIYLPNGQWLLLLAILIVVLADVGAYFSGKKFGAHKLALNVSPGKTWEGFWGGLTANIFLILILGFALNLAMTDWLWLALIIVLTSAVSVLGDLLESMMKRYRGIKDSGSILPGHGGVLDRIDSLCAALPVFATLYFVSNLKL